MPTKCQITPQSKEGIAIRDAYDRLMDARREIEAAGETLGQPHTASQHIIKATNQLARLQSCLFATGVINYKQLTLDGK